MSEPTPARPASGGLRGGELWRVVRTRAFVILGVSGLAITQPLLDLFGKNPEFFVAGGYSGWQIVEFALVIALLPALIGVALTALAAFIDRRAGTAVFAAVVAVLAASFALAILRSLGVDASVIVAVVAIGFGVAAVVAVLRTRGGQLLASYLAVANLVFVAFFLFLSPTSELVSGDGSTGDLGSVDVPPIDGPVVVVLDEFPAATIMRADGTLNAERYPASPSWRRSAPGTATRRASST